MVRIPLPTIFTLFFLCSIVDCEYDKFVVMIGDDLGQRDWIDELDELSDWFVALIGDGNQ